MQEQVTINFVDVETRQSAAAVIRTGEAMVGLALSTEDNGDVEVFLSKEDCRKLADELVKAVSSG